MENGRLAQMAANLATALRSALEADHRQIFLIGGARVAAEEALARYDGHRLLGG
ncbi:MAG: hypothetical protein ACREP9_10890 [Candidatus Dormibacteraceae bacterium]